MCCRQISQQFGLLRKVTAMMPRLMEVEETTEPSDQEPAQSLTEVLTKIVGSKPTGPQVDLIRSLAMEGTATSNALHKIGKFLQGDGAGAFGFMVGDSAYRIERPRCSLVLKAAPGKCLLRKSTLVKICADSAIQQITDAL